jgi:hypothetical protein
MRLLFKEKIGIYNKLSEFNFLPNNRVYSSISNAVLP